MDTTQLNAIDLFEIIFNRTIWYHKTNMKIVKSSHTALPVEIEVTQHIQPETFYKIEDVTDIVKVLGLQYYLTLRDGKIMIRIYQL